MRSAVKKTIQIIALILVWPAAALSLFGRLHNVFFFFAHVLALGPGLPGSFLRAAYYRLTLASCSQDITIWFGSVFTRSSARVAPRVSIGGYSMIGNASIGEGCQISSYVNIPSGRHHHPRDANGHFLDAVEGHVSIGDYVFLAANCVVLANVGDYATVGAGSVVVKDIPPRVVAVGNPARPIGNIALETASS